MRWKWLTSENELLELQGNFFMLLDGVQGHLMPPFKQKERWTGRIGSVSGVRVDTREIFLPLLIRGENLTDSLRLCAKYFNPISGDGRLLVTDDENNTRYLQCRYSSGLEGASNQSGPGWYKVGLTLRALQPHWKSLEEKHYLFTLGEAIVFFNSPFFPLSLSKGTISGTILTDNLGDVEAYPIITATGPLSSLEVSNHTTGKSLEFPSLSLEEGQTLTIDARPDVLSVTLGGSNAFPLMSADSSLWSLPPGSNDLRILTAGTSESSSVRLSFIEEFLTV